jgi:hypothetical protein
MALSGTLKDFGLPEIFQLIGIQRKTGMLTLESGTETVSLKFLEGQIVGAEASSVSLEDRLGEVLVRTGRIDQAELAEALAIQKRTLRRLGHILVERGTIDEEELVEALRVQSSQIVYRLFRWREGTYRFAAADSLEYDEHHFTPISSETVLMEGARMMDEWPLIERRIRNERVILRLTDAGRAIDTSAGGASADDLDIDLGFEVDAPAESGPTARAATPEGPSPEECGILTLVDGRRTVGEIRDRSGIGEFDVCRILADLVTRGLAEEVGIEDPERLARAERHGRVIGLLGSAVVLALAGLGLATLAGNGFTPWRLLADDAATARLREYVALSRLERLERAIRVFYLDAGTVPADLGALAAGGYLRPEDLIDPWGRPIAYEVDPGGYRLEALAPAGAPVPGLSVTRRFSAVEQLLLRERGGPGPPSPPTDAP